MKYTSIDKITRSILAQKGYTIHWYFQTLKLASDALRELTLDSLLVVHTKKYPVNEYKAFPLPCNYVDWVKVGLIKGQFVRPLVQFDGINRLNNFDANGNPILYGREVVDTDYYWDVPEFFRDILMNEYDEHKGRFFGHRQNGQYDGFKVLPERNEIQLSEYIDADYVVIEYISDGVSDADAATKVDINAQRAIEAYDFWKSSKNRDNPFSPEAEAFNMAHRVLRARKNKLTADDVKRIINGNKTAAPK